MKIQKDCPNCFSSFETYQSVNAKCCCRKCSFELIQKETYKKYKCLCDMCGVEFLPKRPKEGGRFCSYKCSGDSRKIEKVDRNGYWYIRIPEHPKSSKQGYVAEHHVVMEAVLGHYIEAGMVVHHINEDKKDNRACNLQYMSDSEHKRLHMLDNHKEGKVCTPSQMARASERMKTNNPCKTANRGPDGKFISKL